MSTTTFTTSRRPRSLLTALVCGLLLAGVTAGCGASNPNISAAEDALENQNYEQALASVDTEIDANPQNAQAYLLRGNILRQQAEAVTDPERHAEIIGDMMDAYNQASEIDPSASEQIEFQLLQAYSQELNRGREAYQRGGQENSPEAYREAAGYMGGAAQIRPDSAQASLFEAFSYINAGDTDRAVAPMQRAVEAGADSSGNYVILAQLQQQEEDYDAAVATLEEATERYPDNDELQSQLLNAYQRSGDSERSMAAYEDAIEREPENATYRYNYGSMLLGEDRFDEAIEQLQRALEIDPSNANAQFNLGAAYTNKAVAANQQIVEMDEQLSEQREELSQQEMQDMQDEMQRLADERASLFEQAIEPLEAARESVRQDSDSRISEEQVCRSLYTAYAQTNQVEQAEQVEECAGMTQ